MPRCWTASARTFPTRAPRRGSRSTSRARPATTRSAGGSDFTSAPNTVSIGAGWYDVNSEQTVNAAYYPLLYWNGRTDSLWSQAAQVSESPVSMNGTRLNTFWVINNDAHYREAYNALFRRPPGPRSRRRPSSR